MTDVSWRRALIVTLLAGSQILVAVQVRAESPKRLDLKSEVQTLRPSKGIAANPCARFGAGFVAVEGSQTCVRIGGAIRVDAGAAR